MKIKAGIIFFLITITFAFPTVHAQHNVVSNAIQAFYDGDYEKAYELSGDALTNVDELSEDYIAAAFYYLAKSRIQVLRIAMEVNNQEKLKQMQNALIESYFDYKEALSTADNKLAEDIMQDLDALYNPILQTGLSALNTGNDRRQPDNVRESAYKAAKGYLLAAKDISNTYLACDLAGQAYIALGDTLAALEMFKESISVYKYNLPSTPDFLMAYVFFRKAIIERYHSKNNMLALGSLMDGENLLSLEYSRLGAARLTPVLQTAYENGMMDLIGFELDIYLNNPDLTDEAIIRFQEVLVLYPEDYDIHVSYANLLEEVDPLLSIDAYETAISIDESRELAWFNLGAMYNNIGSEQYLAGLNNDNDMIADSLYNEANKSFRSSYTYMEEAYRLNPKSISTIRALVQLANSLGLDEQADFYKQKEAELRGF